ncbi:MAG: histidine kinase N-terminal 7TM domain-containing protein [Methanosarcinales archaeon]
MNFYALTGLINGISASVLGLFVYFKNRKAFANKIFGLFCLAVSVWSYGYFLWQIATTAESALFWSRGLMAGSVFIPITYFHFILSLIKKTKEYKKWLIFGYLISIFFFLANFTPLFVNRVEQALSFPYWPKPGILYHPFLLLWLFYVFYSTYLLIRELFIATGVLKSQIRYVLIGTIIGYGGGITNFFLWYDIPIPPIGNILVVFYPIIITYAIIKHRLMDIRVVLGRSAVYFLSFATVIILAFLFMFLNNQLVQPFPFNAVSLLILGAFFSLLFFQLIKFYEKIAAEFFYHTFYNTKIVIAELEERLTQVLELETFSSLITNTLMNTLKLEKIGILVREVGEENFLPQKIIDFSEKEILSLIEDEFLPQHLQETKKPILQEELTPLIAKTKRGEEKERLQRLQEQMKEAGANLLLPFIFERNLIGIIILGNKVSHDAFSSQDVELLTTLSRSASIALKNASLYSEVKNRKEELERFYRLVVGRELKMIELKKKIKELEEKIEEKE